MAGKTDQKNSSIHAALELDQLVHERVRLAILSALGTHGKLSFNELKALTDATDGNLSTHSQKLEAAGYLRTVKGMFGRRKKTSYEITSAGRAALMKYLDTLERLSGEVRGR
jgi:DNA-binding MarR family transcriptional regulator